jgi:hypothetical protein
MPQSADRIEEIAGVDPRALPGSVLDSTRPLVLRGLAAHWPVVKAGLEGPRAAVDYLLRYYRQATVGAFLGAPDIKGRFFYNDDLTGFNYRAVKVKLDTVLAEILRFEHDPNPGALYVGSTTIDTALPGFRAENDFDFGGRDPLASIWIGNRTRIAAHHDLPDNLACVAVGRRRFTLFPPEQLTEPLHRAARISRRRAGHQPGRFPRAGSREIPALRGGAAPRLRRRARPRGCDLHPQPLVAPHRIARAAQRAGELLVALDARVHGHADEHAVPRHDDRARPAAGAARRDEADVRPLRVRRPSRRTSRTFPRAPDA